jgi:hypothetical protein
MIQPLKKIKFIQNAIYAFITTMLFFSGPRLLSAADPASDAHGTVKEQSSSKEMKKAAVQATPRVHFSESKHEFEPVVEGVKVMHDFVIQNQGSAVLRIDKVKTSCGCTVASYPKEIAAGGEGNIRVQFDSKGYGGKTVQKTVTVETNDPKQPLITLNISGRILQFASITPPFARLTGTRGEKIEMNIVIKPQPPHFFKIRKIALKENKNITCTLLNASEEAPDEYVLHLENLKTDAGRYADAITISTDSDIRPQITIGVYGDIKEESSR